MKGDRIMWFASGGIVRRLETLGRGMVLAGLLLVAPLGWAAVTPASPAPTVTLNLKDADIGALISTVAEITGKNFIVDPRVKAKVTVISSKPMNKDEVYQVFLSILDVHGFAVIPSGSVLKIEPDINAKQAAIPTLPDKSADGTDMVATQIIPIHNVSAAQLVPILRPLVPQQGHLAAYPATNVLIISDRASNIARLVKIIARIDVAGDNDVEVIPLQNASATEVVRILTSLSKPTPGEAPSGNAPNFIADERTNSILMTGDKSMRLTMRAIIAHLDTPMETTGNTRVIYLRYAQAKDLVAVLKGVGASQSKGPGGSPAAAASVAGQQFDVQPDEATNSVVITASPDIMRSLEQVIRQLDIRRAQVLVESVIAEVSSDKAKDLGVQWIFDGAPSNNPVGVINFSNSGASLGNVAGAAVSGATGLASAGASLIPEGATLGIGKFNSDTFNFAALLHALASNGNTNILSTPNLLTLDNEEAEIVIGQNVPFVTGSFSSVGSGGTTGIGSTVSNPFQTIQRQDVGLTLKIKPQINEGNAIKLDIQQEVSSVAPAVKGASDLVTNKRSIKTSVLVDDGKMVVLGGLIEDNLAEKVSKVPLLGDVPLLGALFRSKNTTKSKTNLMVFIHPTILRDDAISAQYTTGKYDYIREKQLERQRQGVMLMPEERQPELPTLEQMLQHNPPPAPDKAMLPPVPDNKSGTPEPGNAATPVPAPGVTH
jgi:general secretion pathway protein D